MTTPSAPDNGEPTEGVNLGKGDPTGEAPFDPYRFGKPDHPIPAEFAPPGYTGPVAPPPSPYPPAPSQWPPPGEQANPFSNPPGTPYGGQQPYQYPPAPPGPYGPPPPYPGYQPRRSSGKAVAALVLGIMSIVFCWLSFFDAIFVILGLIFALLALSETKALGGSGRGMALAGLVCTIVGAILATVITVLIVHAVNQCGGFSNSNAPGWDQCVRDHFG
jgi:hypothetical protein